MKWNENGLCDRKKEVLFSELHSLLSSGLDFSRAFRLLIEGEADRRVRALLEKLYGAVVNGGTLWESFRLSGQFTALDYGVLRIGEETGRMDELLSFLADYYSKRLEQRRMISGAVSYPLIILFTATVVLIFMVLVIVPMFEQVYARMGGELPVITRWIIAFSGNFPVYILSVVVLAGVFAGFMFLYGRTGRVRSWMAACVLHLPGVGRIVRKNYEARFCKLLYLIYSSGIPLLKGIEMLEGIITFYPYQRSFPEISRGLQRGGLFADNLAAFPDIYNRKLVTLVRVGEETNRLGDMLAKQGNDLGRELEHELKQLGNLLEPMLILVVGGLVALVLVAMYLPMFRLGGVIG